MAPQSAARALKKPLRLDDEVRFLRSWIEKPLRMGAVMPSSKFLARAVASYVDTHSEAPVIELGPGTGAITDAMIARGVAEKRLVLVEFDPGFCALMRERYPQATVIQGDAYNLDQTLSELRAPGAAMVSGLPLVTKPMLIRVKLMRDAFLKLEPGAPFIQFTYSVAPPIPKSQPGVLTQASERIWMNLPPARVWVYRKG
jgi:phosphatidylethanolamine/phosphatidyl-N-methylethanolamine N-methyltransferase